MQKLASAVASTCTAEDRSVACRLAETHVLYGIAALTDLITFHIKAVSWRLFGTCVAVFVCQGRLGREKQMHRSTCPVLDYRSSVQSRSGVETTEPE